MTFTVRRRRKRSCSFRHSSVLHTEFLYQPSNLTGTMFLNGFLRTRVHMGDCVPFRGRMRGLLYPGPAFLHFLCSCVLLRTSDLNQRCCAHAGQWYSMLTTCVKFAVECQRPVKPSVRNLLCAAWTSMISR